MFLTAGRSLAPIYSIARIKTHRWMAGPPPPAGLNGQRGEIQRDPASTALPFETGRMLWTDTSVTSLLNIKRPHKITSVGVGANFSSFLSTLDVIEQAGASRGNNAQRDLPSSRLVEACFFPRRLPLVTGGSANQRPSFATRAPPLPRRLWS